MEAAVLGTVFAGMMATNQPDDKWNQVMLRYQLLRDELKKRGEFPVLWKEYVITPMTRKSREGVGYNVGKGEIFVCTQGSVNDIFHVLLHELAHNTVTDYDHSSKFWSNLDRLKTIAKEIHIYEYTPTKAFCNGTISD